MECTFYCTPSRDREDPHHGDSMDRSWKHRGQGSRFHYGDLHMHTNAAEQCIFELKEEARTIKMKATFQILKITDLHLFSLS